MCVSSTCRVCDVKVQNSTSSLDLSPITTALAITYNQTSGVRVRFPATASAPRMIRCFRRLSAYCIIVVLHIVTCHRQRPCVSTAHCLQSRIIGTARIACGAGSMKLSGVCLSFRPYVPSFGRCMPLRQVCYFGPGGQEISIDCCTAGGQQQPRRSTARSSKCGQCHVPPSPLVSKTQTCYIL